MINVEDLDEGRKLQKQIELLEELIAEKKRTPMDLVIGAGQLMFSKICIKSIQIGVLEVLLTEKKKTMEELKERCQKQK